MSFKEFQSDGRVSRNISHVPFPKWMFFYEFWSDARILRKEIHIPFPI
jgi:hypothetical protein